MGNVAFSRVILLKSLSTKREARKVTEMAHKNVETIPLTYMFGQRYQQVGNRAISKLYGRLRASSSLASYRRLEKAKLTRTHCLHVVLSVCVRTRPDGILCINGEGLHFSAFSFQWQTG